MKLSELKTYLSGLETLVFVQADGAPVPAHFHITEVGKIRKHYIDCGGTVRDIATLAWVDRAEVSRAVSALEVLGLVADSERLAEQTHDEPSGTLRITAPLTFGTERLAPALSEFSLQNPRVKLDVVLTNAH